jgi:N-acetylneuraminic acid mutarotase
MIQLEEGGHVAAMPPLLRKDDSYLATMSQGLITMASMNMTRLSIHKLCVTFLLILVACGSPAIDTGPSWREGATMDSARSEMAAAVLDERIYVPGGFGGMDDFAVYDPDADSWQSLEALPQGRHHLMTTAHDGRIFIFGGSPNIAFRPTDSAWVYDPATAEWSDLAPMPERRMSGAAVSLGDFIYIVGGSGGTDTLLRYDPVADAWTSLAALNQSREHIAAVVMEGKIYALAGRWGGVGELKSVEIYDPAADVWTTGPSMEEARAGFGAAVLDGRIVAAGGEVLTGRNRTLTSVELFDPEEGAWSLKTDLPVPLHGVPVAAVGDTLYVIGGAERAGSIDNNGRLLIWQP